MYFAPKEIRLKDGRKAVLRSPLPEDAASDLRCMRAVFSETEFLLGSPEDVNPDEGLHATRLAAAADAPDTLLLFCVAEDEVVARLHGFIKPRVKLNHRFRLGVSVRKAYWGQGIASAMLESAEDTACRLGATQLELEVMAHNIRARELYERLGYRIAMVHPEAICFPDGRMEAEYLMIKKL